MESKEKILVDVNEPREISAELLATDVTDYVEICQITLEFEDGEEERVFDFLIIKPAGQRGLERKEVHDFYNSLIDGTLLLQLDKIKDFPGYKYLILEGPLDQLFFEHPEQVDYILSTFFLMREAYDVSIIPTCDHRTTAKSVRHAFKKAGALPPTGLMRRRNKTLARQVQALCSIEGVNKKIATRLLATFKSLSIIASMSAEAFQIVDKVGKKKAQAIYDFFHNVVEVEE